MNSERTMAVGELARLTGVSTAAINFYVRRGLLPKPHKTSRTRAQYNASDVDRINRIRGLQERGLTLRVIARVLDSQDPVAELGLTVRPRRRQASGPVGIESFMAQTGLSREEIAELARIGMLRPGPRVPAGGRPMFDGRDIAAGRALARLLRAGVPFALLARHSEYEPLTRAEAHFLAEHIAAAGRGDAPQRALPETAAAFARLRDYLRFRELLSQYPEWAPDARH